MSQNLTRNCVFPHIVLVHADNFGLGIYFDDAGSEAFLELVGESGWNGFFDRYVREEAI